MGQNGHMIVALSPELMTCLTALSAEVIETTG